MGRQSWIKGTRPLYLGFVQSWDAVWPQQWGVTLRKTALLSPGQFPERADSSGLYVGSTPSSWRNTFCSLEEGCRWNIRAPLTNWELTFQFCYQHTLVIRIFLFNSRLFHLSLVPISMPQSQYNQLPWAFKLPTSILKLGEKKNLWNFGSSFFPMIIKEVGR